ncbi:GxxExxY protein [Flavobacterium sp. J49]|uniref:GxxExxY protein n=1 Tax=Flavobacterium sp. J49 TaxID=2718534 RepID=UPI0015936186|nr:GxxExxY protein [Flavobacterium sp. J49]MBF6641327.1 GxxExxY protein [Flavobacterium sp. J49]NIC02574.1 GxxExxY protein [Flavobacterium sp. J49]
MNLTKSYLTDLTYQINGAAIEVHKFLGPGLLESVYHKCLKKELTERGISFQSELLVPIQFKGIELETDLRCDFFVENCIVIELKAIETIAPIHHAQLLTYMKLLEAPKGILFNFHTVNLFKEGQKTFVNEYFKDLED